MQTAQSVKNAGMGFGGLVAGVAAVASYVHMRTLADRHAEAGQEWLAWITPLSVDGLLVVASIALVLAKLRKEPAPVLAVLAMVVGLLVSLAANFAASGGDIVAKLINIWPPIAFAMSYELILRLAREVPIPRAARVKRDTKTTVAAAVPSPAAATVPSEVPVPAPRVAEQQAADASPAPAPASTGTSLHAVPDLKPDWLTEDMTAREAMYAYLDRHPDVGGAELDRFSMKWLGTKKDYGRGVRRDWLKQRETDKAIGE